MAYSDYGGFAYRNGRKVLERCDCAIEADGRLRASPGRYPGFAALEAGRGIEEAKRISDHATMAHVVLGDTPLLLLLYKQTSARVLLAGREVYAFDPGDTFWERYGDEPVLARPALKAGDITGVPAQLQETLFEIVHHDADGRCAVYARVTPRPDGGPSQPNLMDGVERLRSRRGT